MGADVIEGMMGGRLRGGVNGIAVGEARVRVTKHIGSFFIRQVGSLIIRRRDTYTHGWQTVNTDS